MRLVIGENLRNRVVPELFYKSKRLSRGSRLESWIAICPSNSVVTAKRLISGTTCFSDNSKPPSTSFLHFQNGRRWGIDSLIPPSGVNGCKSLVGRSAQNPSGKSPNQHSRFSPQPQTKINNQSQP